jgi:outer membrane protein OmpA-like peptidoglycan-associated protein
VRYPVKSILVTLSITLIASLLSAQDIAQVTFQGADNFEFTEKADLRIRENGRYIGYLYKEVRAYFDLADTRALSSGDQEYSYTGAVYVLEDQKRNSRQAKWIDESYEIALSATDKGYYRTDSPSPHPRTRGFPVLAGGPLAEGDSWREYGSQVITTRDGAPATEIEFYCEFKYKGEDVYLERPVHVIHAQYATRYRRGQDPDGDPELAEATGKHLVTMYIEKGGGWMFLRDQVDEQYRFVDGSTRDIEGFYLTWYEGAPLRDRGSEAEAVKEKLADAGVDDVAVTSTDEGLSISIQNIHFIADQAIILPSECDRLDAVAEALKSVGDRTIKAVGHTADIGTAESQYLLSVERAKVVVEEMVKRGLPAKIFIYEGRGGTEPVGSNDSEEGRASNRRVEFIIL